MKLKMSSSEVMEFLDEVFPQVRNDFVIDALEPMHAHIRMPVQTRHLRPGGTVSGPSIFSLVDVSVYILVLSMIGKQALAVTTNCSIDFMRKPTSGKDLLAEARLLKLGRVLAVGDVLVFSQGGDDKPVARASLTYSIPPK